MVEILSLVKPAHKVIFKIEIHLIMKMLLFTSHNMLRLHTEQKHHQPTQTSTVQAGILLNGKMAQQTG